jgi:inner membrane protein
MILAPFSDWRAAIGTTFIIDLWFSGIIVAGLVFSILLRNTRIPALAALALLVGYIGFQYVQRQRAMEFGEAYARAHGGGAVNVQPRPVSPFNWTVFVSDADAHRYAHVNLVRKAPKPYRPGDGFIARVDAPYLPLDQAIWVKRSRYGEPALPDVKEAWNSDALGFLRWFEELPAFDGMSEMGRCVWFVDLRFDTPGRDGVPFPFGACRERSGSPWRAYRRQGTEKALVR